jgi:hypothetical protein
MHIPEVIVHSKHKRSGQIFHANVAFRGNVWRDWVWVDWGQDGTLPNKLWGFVDLSGLPPNSKVNYGGINSISPGIYAIVESATMIEDEHSELVLSLETDVVHNAHGDFHDLHFFLADVEAFVEPAIVVPDIGGKPNSYLLVINKSHWRAKFEEWLDAPHDLDEMDPIEAVNNDDDGNDNSDEEDENEENEESEDEEGRSSDESTVPAVSDDEESDGGEDGRNSSDSENDSG